MNGAPRNRSTRSATITPKIYTSRIHNQCEQTFAREERPEFDDKSSNTVRTFAFAKRLVRSFFRSPPSGERGEKGAEEYFSPRDKVLTSSSGWSETAAKHIRENGSLKDEAAPNEEARLGEKGRDMG